MDVNYEEDNTKISPPQKYFETEFIKQVHAIAKPLSLIAFNTIIEPKNKAKLVAQVKEIKESSKYITKTVNDKNEVMLFAKGVTDVPDCDKRVQAFGKMCQSLQLNKGVFMNKKTMQMLLHTELMRKL